MSEEKDLDQIENGNAGSDESFGGLEDFVELDDLQNLEGLADLSSLGDISDLGDLSDLADAASGNLDDLDVSSDIPLPVMEETETEEAVAPETVQAVQEAEEPAVLPDEAGEFIIPDKEEMQAGLENPDIAEVMEEPVELNPEITDNDSGSTEETVQETLEEGVPEEEPLGIMDEDVPPGDTAAGSGDDIIPEEEIPLEEGISLEQDILPEETTQETPEEPEALQEESVPEGPAGETAEEDIGIMDSIPDGLLDNIGISAGTGGEEPQAGAAIMEEPDSSGAGDMLDGMLDSLGIPEALPADDAESTETVKTKKKLQRELPPDDPASEPVTKKPGFFKRIFGNVVTDEIAEAERKAKEDEEQQAILKAEEELKARQEKEAKRAEAAEAKEAKKAEKAAKKAEKAEEKAAKKAEKAAKKAAEKEAEEQEVVGKLNKPGVIIVVTGAALILAGVVIGTEVFGYNSSKSEAEKYFSLQRYSEAYNEARGTKLEDRDPELYNKIVTVMKVQQSLDTYSSYAEMKYYPDALNALLRGLQKYDNNIETAMDFEVEGDIKVCRNKILSILKDEFGLSEKGAYDILSLDDDAYTERVVNIAKKKM